MKRFLAVSISLVLLAIPVLADSEDTGEQIDELEAKRESIDAMADETLERLFVDSPGASEAFEAAVGYAVFDNLKFTFLISGGGGVGVAVNKAGGQRTYMKMGTGGIGLGLGGQSFQVVFMFENEETYRKFVEKGWHADTSAHAVAGTAGANVGSTFTNGLAVYQLTNKGLMAVADIVGTKYWKHKKLNVE